MKNYELYLTIINIKAQKLLDQSQKLVSFMVNFLSLESI
jgi:hypothetical protein